jgi:hypothetical protein
MAAAAKARKRPAEAARNAMTASGAGKFMLLLGGIHMRVLLIVKYFAIQM